MVGALALIIEWHITCSLTSSVPTTRGKEEREMSSGKVAFLAILLLVVLGLGACATTTGGGSGGSSGGGQAQAGTEEKEQPEKD